MKHQHGRAELYRAGEPPGWRTTGLANHRAGEPGDRQRRLTDL